MEDLEQQQANIATMELENAIELERMAMNKRVAEFKTQQAKDLQRALTPSVEKQVHHACRICLLAWAHAELAAVKAPPSQTHAASPLARQLSQRASNCIVTPGIQAAES